MTAEAPAAGRRTSLVGRLAGLDQRRLLYLHEAASAGSMRGGAERLSTSASALSRQIMRLEADLQVALLERHGRGVQPTEAGALLLQFYLEQRSQLDSVVTQIQDLAEMRHGSVSLALGEGFLAEVMGPPLRQFIERHPRLRLDLQVGSTEDIVRRILDDEAHLALVYNLPTEPRIQSHAARRHAMRVVTHPEHRLARLGRSITLEDLQDCAVGVLPNAYGVRQVLLTAEHRGRIRLTPRLTVNSSRALLRFAEEWNGVVLMTGFAVAPELREGRLVSLEFKDAVMEGVEVHLATRRGRRLPVAATHLLRHLRATLPMLR